jgi:hypothetical protein
MAAKKVKVTYQDGREETVKVLPRAQVMTEEYLKGFKVENAIAGTYYLGWAALHVAGKEPLDYETWLNKIDDVEDVEELVDPTPEDQSADTSSGSPS